MLRWELSIPNQNTFECEMGRAIIGICAGVFDRPSREDFFLGKPMSLTALEYKIIIAARKNLDAEQLPWCEHWLIGKIQNEDRFKSLPISSESILSKALQKLIKKKLVNVVGIDRYTLNVEATRYIK